MKFNVKWKNVTKKAYEKVFERTNVIEANTEKAARELAVRTFGNAKTVEIISVEPVAEEE